MLDIAVGVTVTWENPPGSTMTHTVTWLPTSAEIFNSGNPPSGIGPGGTFSHTFRTPGTYYYYCQYYGDSTPPAHGMVGIITVH
jgi:plastocyanin